MWSRTTARMSAELFEMLYDDGTAADGSGDGPDGD
jgi:hypothetical protein